MSEERKEVKPYKSFTQEEWESYESNIAKDKKEASDNSYKEGKDVGRKHFIRDSKESLGLDFEGTKGEDFLKSIQQKALSDASISVDDKVKSLQNDLETLRKNQAVDLEKIQGEANSFKSKYNTLLNDQEISKHIPDKLQGVNKTDAMTIIKSEFDFSIDDDGNRVVKKGGEVLKNKALNPIDWETAIKDSLLKRSWLTNGEGRGEQKQVKTSGFKKMSELNEYFAKEGINPKSSKAMAIIQDVGKEDKDFDFVN